SAKDLEGEIRHLEARVSEEPVYRESLNQHEIALNRWSSERLTRESKLNALRDKLAALNEKEQRLKERQERLKEAEQEAAELTEQISRCQARIDQDRVLLASAAEIRVDFERLNKTR